MSVALALALVLGFAAGAAYVDTGSQPTEARATVEACAPWMPKVSPFLRQPSAPRAICRSGLAMRYARFEVLSTA
jgi:hypothetical protein